MADPTGRWLAVSPELFKPWIPPDFFLPGLYVFVFFGLTPLFLAYALLTNLKWPLAEMVINGSGSHWAWFAAVGLAMLLSVWTLALVLMVGFQTLYQLLDALLSLLILGFLLLPSVRRAHNQS